MQEYEVAELALTEIDPRCRGRPAVEVTKVVEMVGGKPYLPAELRDAMPPSNDGRRPR